MSARRSVAAGACAFAVVLIASHFRSTPYNNYVLLASAFLHGHTWIDWPGSYIDALAYHGQRYVIEAPVPAILLLPYIAIAGTAANQTVLAAVLAGVAAGAAWALCERIGTTAGTAIWLCAFLVAGTDLLWCAMLGDVWFVAHVSAVCFTMLALAELFGKRRGALVGLWGVLAAGSRFSLVLALPVYAAVLALSSAHPNGVRIDRRRLRPVAAMSAVVMAGAVVWVWYNLARFGTFADIGYTAWYHQDAAGMPSGSPFRLQYVPYELWSFFVQAPAFSATFPWIAPSYSGVALTWTSPALIFAAWAKRPRATAAAMWIAAVLVAAPSFLYYVNGFAQYGMRHALDFIPFLFALMALAARDRLPGWVKVLIVYSCAASLYGVWYWNAIVRAGS